MSNQPTITLSNEMSAKVVRYAKRRLEKASKPEEEAVAHVPAVSSEQLELGIKLGNGSFSNVFEIKSIRGRDVSDHLVLKTLRPQLLEKPPMFAACAADLIKEGMILASLNHPNILSVKAWSSSNGVEEYSSGQHDAFYLILERIEDTLGYKLDMWREYSTKGLFPTFSRQRRNNKSIAQRSDIVLDLAEAVRYLHSQGIIHRDLKPDNIGFDHDGVLKVLDFDVARIVPEAIEDPHATFKMTKRIGSLRYMSPECALGRPYNCKYDVYTFSLLCHELLTLQKPFDDITRAEFDDVVFHSEFRPTIPSSWPREMHELLERCWCDDIEERPTMEEALPMLRQCMPGVLAASGHSTTVAKNGTGATTTAATTTTTSIGSGKARQNRRDNNAKKNGSTAAQKPPSSSRRKSRVGSILLQNLLLGNLGEENENDNDSVQEETLVLSRHFQMTA